MTCDKDEAAVEGEEGADAVEEVLEVNLVPDEGRRAVGGTDLHDPAPGRDRRRARPAAEATPAPPAADRGAVAAVRAIWICI